MDRWMLLGILAVTPLWGVEKLSVRDGYIFVDVTVNHRGPFRMALDTGSTSCALTPEAARAAGLVPDERVILTTANGDRIIPGVTSTHVQVGETALDGVEVLVDALDAVKGVDRTVSGVLGQNFLGRFAYVIDYREERLWLGPEADAQAKRFGNVVSAESVEGRWLVPVRLGAESRPWRMILDSGTNRMVVRCGAVCGKVASGGQSGRLRTNAGDRLMASGRLQQVQIGALQFSGADALLMEQSPHAEQGDGLLPANWFSAVYVGRDRKVIGLER